MLLLDRKTKASKRREKIRKEFWASEDPWTGENEKGWFRAPRTLPLLLGLIGSKELSGKYDPTRVYLELLARHIDGGVIEMSTDEDHSYSAGYQSNRSVRSWQERMKVLEKIGLIKTKQIGNQAYKYVFLVHPTSVIKRLHDENKISQRWWDTYRARQMETGEAPFEERMKMMAKKVISLVPGRVKEKHRAAR